MSKIPATMAAVLLRGAGGFDQLEYREDVATPTPGEGEVLIKVAAAAINNTDVNTRAAWYSRGVEEGTTATGGAAGYAAADSAGSGWTGAPPTFPRIQGADACGRIVAVGPGVAAGRVGERVIVEPAFRAPLGWAPYRAFYFGSEWDGAFADYARVPAAHAHRIASPLSDAELATFPCAYTVAETMLARGGLAAGETVLVTGASGGVGSAAVQLARRRGARVLALAQPGKADLVAALGAARVLPSGADVAAELGSESLDMVVDVVGGAGFPGLLEALKRGGRYAASGAIAGPKVALDLRTLYLKDLSLIGCTIPAPGTFASLVGYIERGEVRPLLAATYPLAAIVEAQRAFLSKRLTGKIVLIPPGAALG